MADAIDLAIQQVEESLTLPPIPTLPAVELPIDTDVALNTQRKIAKAQDTEVEIANKKLELLQSEFLISKALSFVPIPQVPAAVAAALALLQKARASIQDRKLKAKLAFAKKQKQIAEQRQSATRKNIQRGAATYRYPIKPT